ncbi:MAG: nucleotidyltransferase [Bryobacteraceae bacterium]|nr:nucleotidyltransferase [Bryobacteraceae bacterium]
MINNKTFSKRIKESLDLTKSAGRWEQLMVTLLRRLELDPAARKDAEKEYKALAERVADRLDLPHHSVDVIPQGSMRTQTTIRPPGRTNFDLDVVFVLSGPRYENPDPELFFEEFGKALDGDEATTGSPTRKNRCWRLPFPNKPYYFDVTPATPDPDHVYGAALRVRDPETAWSPSNPTEFAQWFCDRADLQFSFQSASGLGNLIEARKSVEPLPSDPVRIDDILRRTIQLVKLHRDNVYFYESDKRKEAWPISVIIVTLAGQAFENIWATRRNSFSSPMEVVLAVIEDMPNWITRNANGHYLVCNPALGSENFAERWNTDQGLRASEFFRWYQRLENDIEALLTDEYSKSSENKLKAIFGQVGVDAWMASLPENKQMAPLLKGLVASSGIEVSNPRVATPVGRNTRTLA